MFDPEDDELFEEGYDVHREKKTAAFGTTGTVAPMLPPTKRRRWNIGTRIDL